MKQNDSQILEAGELAEYMYSKLADFPEEEKWETARKLRSSANDLLFFTAQAIGNATPSGAEYEWGSARKSAVALKAIYRFAARQKFIELEPEIMVRLDTFIKQINIEVDKARKQAEANDKKDMDNWLKQYKIWSETKL